MPSLFAPFSYASGATPKGYRCAKCGAEGVKLWRQYQTFAEHIRLLCAACALKDQGKSYEVGEDGKHDDGRGYGYRTDQIGCLVPAVPTEEGETFWGYASVPEAGCAWWYGLPVKGGAGV
jgi:hypothetical protein